MLDSIAMHEGEENVREKAVFALSQQDNSASVAALRALAGREDLDPELREKVVFWIGQSHAAESSTFLEDLFTRTTGEELKQKILFALSQHGGATDWILNVASDARQPDDVRKQAVFWASQGGVGIDRLMSLYGRITEPEVREHILFAISQRHDPAAVDALMAVAKTDKDPELRKKAVFWLGQSSDPRAGHFLQELINQ
jgi:HEAT repeat protein